MHRPQHAGRTAPQTHTGTQRQHPRTRAPAAPHKPTHAAHADWPPTQQAARRPKCTRTPRAQASRRTDNDILENVLELAHPGPARRAAAAPAKPGQALQQRPAGSADCCCRRSCRRCRRLRRRPPARAYAIARRRAPVRCLPARDTLAALPPGHSTQHKSKAVYYRTNNILWFVEQKSFEASGRETSDSGGRTRGRTTR